eukprot:COSAG01_NODE_17569_length_1139_cov_123.780769_1_plen_209_part_10
MMRGMWRTVSCGHRRGTSRWWTRSWRRCRTRTSPSSTSATPARGTRYSAVLNGRLPQLTKRPAQLTTLSGLDRAAQDGRGPALTVHHVRALCPPPPSLFLGSVAVSGRGDHWCAVLAPQASFASHCARGASAVGVTMPSLAVHLIGMVVHQCTLLRRRGHQRCCLWLANGEHGASIITRTCTAPAVAAAPLLAGTGSAGPLPTAGAAAG